MNPEKQTIGTRIAIGILAPLSAVLIVSSGIWAYNSAFAPKGKEFYPDKEIKKLFSPENSTKDARKFDSFKPKPDTLRLEK